MHLTDYRTMLYLPHSLYRQSLRIAKRRKTSLAAFIREALQRHLRQPEQENYDLALKAGFGLWKARFSNGRRYERRLRAGWAKR